MNIEIIGIEQDPSGRYKVRVLNNETMESIFLFFSNYPSLEEINEQFFNYLNSSNSNIPNSISARQIRLWLLQNNVTLEMVNSVIQNIVDPYERDYIGIEWEYAPYIERSHPMLTSLAQALGFDESDIDRCFIEAINI